MENLKNQGWILTESSLQSMESDGGAEKVAKKLLNLDLRDVGAGIGDLSKGKFECIDHELAVLQVMKARNISAPKANETSKTAPKLLKLQLTDGKNTYSAIEMEPITAFDIETLKPGTKIALKVKLLKMANGHLLLTPNNLQVLGGHVEDLVSKWEVTRSLAGIKGSRSGAGGLQGPPAFIPFGQKIQQNVPSDQPGFKSLQPSKPKESGNDDTEFKAQRQAVIAEASKAGTKKTFGGGSKTLVDSNVQKVMDKGYSEDQATMALKYSRNNVEKALIIIKKREEHQNRANSNEHEPREYHSEKRGGKYSHAEPSESTKPSGGVSLFDFLENKIPAQTESTKQAQSYHDKRFENNMSSSFRKTDNDFPSRGYPDHKPAYNNKYSSNGNARGNGRPQQRDYRGQQNSREPNPSWDNDNRRENIRDNSRKPAYNSTQRPSNSAGSGYHSKEPYHHTDNSNNFNSAPPGRYNSTRGKPHDNYSGPKGYPDRQSDFPDHKYSARNEGRAVEKSRHREENIQTRTKAPDARLNTSNYPPLTPAVEPPKAKTYPKHPGYAIAGFQNKEANENARKALQTKNLVVDQPASKPQHQQQNFFPQAKMVPHNVSKPPPPFPDRNIPQSFVSQPVQPLHQAMAAMTIAAPIPAPVAMQHQRKIAPPPGMTQPQFKCGDFCLAKYWEDGQFYSARITGVSESTYVVHFTDYGNAEEVRKIDCFLPR